MAAEHGILVSPVNGRQGVWGGRFSFVQAGAGAQIATVTDTEFTSRIIRASNHIAVTAQNITAARLIAGWNPTTATHRGGIYFQMTNNASILAFYDAPGAGGTATFYFEVFSGGVLT